MINTKNLRELHLIVCGCWWSMMESGEKTDEYRDLTPYWIKRFCNTRKEIPYVYCILERCCRECFDENRKEYCIYPFDVVVFHRGYTNITMTFEIKDIVIGRGREGWGADPNKDQFIIKLGKKINQTKIIKRLTVGL